VLNTHFLCHTKCQFQNITSPVSKETRLLAQNMLYNCWSTSGWNIDSYRPISFNCIFDEFILPRCRRFELFCGTLNVFVTFSQHISLFLFASISRATFSSDHDRLDFFFLIM
jgi:hypothetical protein